MSYKSRRKSFIILLSITEPGTILRTSHILTDVIFTDYINLPMCYLLPHYTDEENVAQRLRNSPLITYLNKCKNEIQTWTVWLQTCVLHCYVNSSDKRIE